MSVVLPEGERFLEKEPVTKKDLDGVLDIVTQGSKHTAGERLKNGFLTAQDGYRFGLCGTGIVQQGEVTEVPLPQAEPTEAPEEVPPEDLPAEGWVRYTIAEADISIDLPEDWLGLTYDLGTESPLAELYDMTEEHVKETLSSTGAHLYAITGLFKNHQIYIFTAPGGWIDMRKTTKGLDIDEITEMYRQSMPQCEVIESDLRWMGESNYIRMYFTIVNEGIKFASLEYDVIINGVQYVIQYVAPYSSEIDAERIGLMDAAVESIRFLQK